MRAAAPERTGRAGAARAERRDAHRGRLRRRETAMAYGLLAPMLIGVAAFLLVPIVVLVGLSFMQWDILRPMQWVALDNWTRSLTSPAVWRSIGVTALFVALVVPAQIAVGLWLATMLVRNLPGSTVMRTILVLPWVSAPVVLGIVWRWIFSWDGVLNTMLDERIPWLTSAWLALPVVAFVQAWSQVGYVSLFFMAGLGNIPDSVIEAARIDGASERRIFWQVKLPLLKPTMFFVAVTGIIGAFQSFDLVYSLSPNGGPGGTTDLVAARIYAQAITHSNVGDAAVLAIILFAVLVAITLAQNAYFSRSTTYDR
ncbi:MAG: sugar ABC transporter permease [Microbacteriaceae bacterium]|nr:sugar ABC transporter permease [Microbacteriaceae bacterium]